MGPESGPQGEGGEVRAIWTRKGKFCARLRAWDLRGLLYYMFLVHLGQIGGIFVLILETKDSGLGIERSEG